MILQKINYLLNSITNDKSVKEFFHPFFRLFFQVPHNSHRAKVMNIINENTNTYTLQLKPEKKWHGFKAGQFIEISLEIDGRLLTRIFSISSAPELLEKKGMIELTIQKQKHGKVTPILNKLLKPGVKIGISEAKGEFINNNSNPKLFIAAGSGITPLRSLLKSLINLPDTSVNLIYYARHATHLFADELKQINSAHKNINIQLINSTTEGRICNEHLHKYCPDINKREAYICGPSQMIESTQELLSPYIPQEKIHFEYFGSPPTYNINVEHEGKITFNQSEIQITEANIAAKTILEMAESKGLKPKHSCRMGVCHQCVCKKEKGVIYNILTKTYSDNGKQNIQPCVSVAVGDVTLDL